MRAVFVGGPAHGTTREIPDPLPLRYNHPRAQEITAALWLDPTPEVPLPWAYDLVRGQILGELVAAYICRESTRDLTLTSPPPCGDPPGRINGHAVALADEIWRMEHEAYLPDCVAPDCGARARCTFFAAEYGRFAGRYWEPDEAIYLCPEHAHDVYRAQGAPASTLPDWLRQDARNLDPLDAYDVGHASLLEDQDEIVAARGRVLRTRSKP